MLPNLRFAIGAVLAGMVLIITVFGLAAAVRVAHYRAAGPSDAARRLAYAEPADGGHLAGEPRQFAAMRTDVPGDDRAVTERFPIVVPDANRVAAIDPDTNAAAVIAPDAQAATVIVPEPRADAVTAPDTDVTVSINTRTRDREPADEVKAEEPKGQAAMLDKPPATIALTAPSAAVAEPAAALPDCGTADADADPLELTERVVALPAFPTAGHGFVPPYPITLPSQEPDSKPAVKPKKRKKKAARRRVPIPPERPPLASIGFPIPGTRFPLPSTGSPMSSQDRHWWFAD